jgi:hypothetical protein
MPNLKSFVSLYNFVKKDFMIENKVTPYSRKGSRRVLFFNTRIIILPRLEAERFVKYFQRILAGQPLCQPV